MELDTGHYYRQLFENIFTAVSISQLTQEFTTLMIVDVILN